MTDAIYAQNLFREAFPELRPDGSDRKSFPSGHTSMSFAAAATLFNRQGQDAAAVVNLKAIVIPVIWNKWLKFQLVMIVSHSSKSLNNS